MVRFDKLPPGAVILNEGVAGNLEPEAEPEKRNKYGNRRTEVDGIMFHSAKEAKRYTELKLMEKAGAIRGLRLQVPFDLEVNGVKICRYVADFVYEEQIHGEKIFSRGLWGTVIEDVKGKRTDVYRIKAKLMKAILNIEVRET